MTSPASRIPFAPDTLAGVPVALIEIGMDGAVQAVFRHGAYVDAWLHRQDRARYWTGLGWALADEDPIGVALARDLDGQCVTVRLLIVAESSAVAPSYGVCAVCRWRAHVPGVDRCHVCREAGAAALRSSSARRADVERLAELAKAERRRRPTFEVFSSTSTAHLFPEDEAESGAEADAIILASRRSLADAADAMSCAVYYLRAPGSASPPAMPSATPRPPDDLRPAAAAARRQLWRNP